MSLTDIPKHIDEGLEAYRELERRPRAAIVLGVLLVLFLVSAAIAPQWMPFYDRVGGRVDLGTSWLWTLGGVAFAVAVLIALYVAALSRVAAGDPERARSFLIYSPRSFADDVSGNRGGQRALYVGDGATSWLAVSEHPQYDIAEGKLRPGLEQIVQHVEKVRSVISLGPGDGKVDAILLDILGAKNHKNLAYIPVDISEGLLLTAMKHVKGDKEDIPMRFGILGDFEYGWDSFSRLLQGQQHPRLFTLLGNTVSNFDDGLETFFPKIWAKLKKDDYILFDVLLGDFDDLLGAYDESKSTYDANRLFPDTEVMRLYKGFVAQGARRISRDRAVFDDAAHSFTSSLIVERRKTATSGYDQLHLLYRGKHETRTIFKWRRYMSPESLDNWLLKNLGGCVIKTSSQVTDDGKTTRLALLRCNAAK